MQYKYETELYPWIKKYFALTGKSFLSFEEVMFFNRRIDIVSYSIQEKIVISTEAKLKDWGKAIEQCLIYQLCSDFVYIAMPLDKFKNIDKKILLDNGIGFMGIDLRGGCTKVIEAAKSKFVKSDYKKEIIERIEENK